MKYMIMMFGSQQDYDMLTGKDGARKPWDPADVAKMNEFMGAWNNALVETGEFVEGHALTAPVHARRIGAREGAPVVTDGPYAETQEVLAGFTIVECASYDRATEIAAQLAGTPHPDSADLGRDWYVDVRPLAGGPGDYDL
ncbi:YciI family protein [Spirillospora sp. NPDC047279]|uniref:YciI family protein n=1 Tax=Spirillospora sp. NPDC047279 TaxID=3155478 RepID=UPI0033FD0E0E